MDITWGPAKRARLYLLDRSGSMGGERFKVAVRALVREIALAPKGMNLGVYAFSNRSEKFVPIGEIGMDSVGEIAQKRKMINDLVKSALNTEPYGSTALYRSLYDLFPILEREMNTRGIVLGDIIVISDGMDNYGGIKQDEIVKKSRELFIPVHIMGIEIPYFQGRNFRKFTKDMGGAYNDGLWQDEPTFANDHKLSESIPQSKKGPIVFSEFEWVKAKKRGTKKGSIGLRDSDRQSINFYIDDSLVEFTLSLTHSGESDDIDFSLLAPGGAVYPIHSLFSSNVFDLGCGFLRSVALDKSLIGEWTLVFRNQTTKDIPVQVTVLGQSIVTSTAQNDVVHSVIIGQTPFSVINIAEKVPHTINFITQRGGKFLTKLNMEVTIEDQWGKTKALCPNDAGIPPDLVANDGIYTADFQDVGVYLIKSKIHNRNGKACTTTLAERDYFELPKNLEGPSPVFGEPIQENFERTVYVPLSVVYDEKQVNPRHVPDLSYLPRTENFFRFGEIEGPKEMLLGIEREFSVDIFPSSMSTILKNYISWDINSDKGATIIPDPKGRPNVVRLRFNSHHSDEILSIKNTVPKALRDLISEQTKSFSISTATPKFLGRGFGETSPLIFFARKDTRFDGALQLPQGYSSAATWSVGDVSGVNLSTVIRVIQQDATGCTVRAELPGEYILSLTSDAYPDKISNSFRIKAIYKEPEGSQPGKPGDDAGSKPRPIPGGDPGGDDDVDTDPGDDGDGGSGGGGPGRPGRPPRVPEAPDPEEPVPLPPGVSAVLVDGRDLGPGGTALVEGIRSVSLVFRFADVVERHSLSASLLSAEGVRNEAEATIDGARLSADGLALTANFHPREEGRYRIAYGFERKDGVRAKGSFVVRVTGGSGIGGRGDERRGGGCSALDGAAILFLLACFLLPCRAEGVGDRS